MKRTHKLINKINVIKGVFLLMCITIIAANLNISQAVKAVETTQDNKIKSGEVENQKYTGTCRDNQGWIENPEDNDIYSVAYFVKNDNRRFETIDNPITAPNKYYKISCSSISRVHYKDTNGNLLKINNQFVTSVISRDIDEVTETVVNGKLETTRTNKKNYRYILYKHW